MLPTDCGEVEADRCHHGVVHSPCMGLLGHWLIYVLLLIIIVTAIWSANYLQKALMVYGTTEVLPVYYCTFTLAAIVGNAAALKMCGPPAHRPLRNPAGSGRYPVTESALSKARLSSAISHPTTPQNARRWCRL
jgi:hypothetical protein